MNILSARRLSLVLILGAASMLASGTAFAQGTDPCPKGMVCTNRVVKTTNPPTTGASTGSSSVTGTVVQSVLIFFGLA